MCKAFEVDNCDVPHRGKIKCESTQDTTNTCNELTAPNTLSSANPSRGMPKTEGLDEEDSKPPPKLVTPCKCNQKNIGSNNLVRKNKGQMQSTAR
jgi:hypothetical protein